MSDRYAEVIILAEDALSANLLRRYVQRALNLRNERIRPRISPSGSGDAKQWVLSQYPVEVKALRGRHPKTALIVHMDADTSTVSSRMSQLADTLQLAGLPPRRSDERICIAVPKMHIETWLCALTGHSVDESQDCKGERLFRNFNSAVQPAALQLFQLTRPNAPVPLLPSLASSIQEFRRL